ncbi:MAG TPA: GlsB/YeaQ/YmgE family stress response membrane protein [Gemmataceae bacterium]|nr:GlsB/YeaQ/YmgE family stress response membrane protein [Gemmataceae bacterium]
MWTFIVFAVIGLLTGAAARLLYPGRRVTAIAGTMLLGMLGAVVGGMISWLWWPSAGDEFQIGNLIVSVLGAMLVVVVGAVVGYSRSLRGQRTMSQ